MARDPIRRKASREAQNARRRAERAAKALRKEANRLEKERRVRMESDGLKSKGTTSLTATRMRNEARRLERFAANTTTAKQSDLSKLQNRIAELDARIAKTREPLHISKYQFNFDISAAQRGHATATLGDHGSKEMNKQAVKLFFAFYREDWQGVDPDERIDFILKKNNFSSIQEAVDAALDPGVVKKIMETLGIDFSNVDTESDAYQKAISLIEEKYLDKDIHAEYMSNISTLYQNFSKARREALGL